MEQQFIFADMHCHPTLKTFGHTFQNNRYGYKRREIRFQQKNSFYRKFVHRHLGLTKFSQADFTSLKAGNVRIVTASLYPFEKGFFLNACKHKPLAAYLANLITGISYRRIRSIQQTANYFDELEKEYQFLVGAVALDKSGDLFLPTHSDGLDTLSEHKTAIVIAIEGAHVFNSGLRQYGRETTEAEIFENIHKVKNWKIPPVTITFAHNFNNDFCGHASSLEPLGRLVNQKERLHEGFTPLGYKVLELLLDAKKGRAIYPDIKHMSLRARKEYYRYLDNRSAETNIPIIVSHGAVTGTSWEDDTPTKDSIFCNDDINFYDEELVKIAQSNGLFAIQLDGRRLIRKKEFRKLFRAKNRPLASAEVIWKQLAHIAKVLDQNNLPAWDSVCIGSDFDGTTTPLPGIYTAADLPLLAENLVGLATDFLKNGPLTNKSNQTIAPREIVARFCFQNIYNFYRKTL